MKTKLLFILLLLISPVYVFSEDFVFDGTWTHYWDGLFPWSVSRMEYPLKEYSWGRGKYEPGLLEIDIQTKLFYHYDGYQGFSIHSIELIDDNIYRITLQLPPEITHLDRMWYENQIIHFLSDDIMYIFQEASLNDIHEIPKEAWKWKYIRISGPARIPVKDAVLNDSRVRCRTEPNLNCETWGWFNTGDKVRIKDISPEPFEIDGESWYWYKVESDTLPDGWVYGKYLDIEE